MLLYAHNETVSHRKMNLENIMQSVRNHYLTKDHILHAFTYMTCLEHAGQQKVDTRLPKAKDEEEGIE